MSTLATTLPELKEARVTTKHAFTGRMCAASRDVETKRPDSLFVDPLAHKLAGTEGRGAPMGSWILVPRTRRGDDCLVEHYGRGCRQLVLLGAGMDARAYRAFAPGADAPPDARSVTLDGLAVFEVDQQTTFDVKEPLVARAPLAVESRRVVGTDFAKGPTAWSDQLLHCGFDASVPTVWLSVLRPRRVSRDFDRGNNNKSSPMGLVGLAPRGAAVLLTRGRRRRAPARRREALRRRLGRLPRLHHALVRRRRRRAGRCTFPERQRRLRGPLAPRGLPADAGEGPVVDHRRPRVALPHARRPSIRAHAGAVPRPEARAVRRGRQDELGDE